MIVPSIDIMNGRAVQLRQGREFVLDGGDPLERLDAFATVGPVAVVDLDAALGKGSNVELIETMVRRAPCRVGGGIRDLDTARRWLDAGATHIVIGTAASPQFCAQLPRDRVIAAVDAVRGTVVVDGWQTPTADGPVQRIAHLQPVVAGFLLTQVEHEGEMQGFDMALVEQAAAAAGDVRLTAAGGITTYEEIAQLDRLGVDAQIGMALYTDRITLGGAVGAVLAKGIDGRLWPTVVCREDGVALGLAWSTKESLQAAVDERRGIYWSRSRNELWRKGATSGATQELLRVEVDCDRDALKFTVRQHGTGFCHTGQPACWPLGFDLRSLSDAIAGRLAEGDAASGTVKAATDSGLLEAKLVEEAAELAGAETERDVVHEAADLLYFTLVAMQRKGIALDAVRQELALRHRRIARRPMVAKGPEAV